MSSTNYTVITEQEWNTIPPQSTSHHKPGEKRKPKPRKPRVVASKYVIDTIEDTGNKHCYLMDRQIKKRELLELSEKLGGQIWGRPDYFVHSAGHYSTTYIWKDKWPEYNEIRQAIQTLVSREDIGFTPSQSSTKVDEWLGFDEPIINQDLRRYLLPRGSFCTATPCDLPLAYEHDMSSAYWEIVKAIPTPRIRIDKNHPGIIIARGLRGWEATKWEKMLTSLAPYKAARLAVVGNWVAEFGSRKWRYASYWYMVNGKERQVSFRRKPRLSTFGMLVVRLVYELCQEEYLTDNGVYAWVDCVITESPVANYWQSLNVPNKPKAFGPLHIARSDLYKIGPKKVGVWLNPKYFKEPSVALKPHLIPRKQYYHPYLFRRWSLPPLNISTDDLPTLEQQITLPPHQLALRLRVPPTQRQPLEKGDFINVRY